MARGGKHWLASTLVADKANTELAGTATAAAAEGLARV